MLKYRSLLASLASTLELTLRGIVPAGRPCALVGFPDHSNVGDSAIWLGARVCLQRLGVQVAYTCSMHSYDAANMLRRIGDGPILITGGGNFGDLWPACQEFLHLLLATFPDRPIIQLPQSSHFKDRHYLYHSRACVEAHPAFTLLLRDLDSFNFARTYFDVPCVLCPDLALALGPLRRLQAPTQDIVWLARGDHEAQRWPGLPPAGCERGDWLCADLPPITDFDARARWQVERGCRFLTRGRVVIADRLHGHLLCLLLGLPHVALDNSYGKLRSFQETWTGHSGLNLWAMSPAEALWKARELLACETRLFPGSRGEGDASRCP